MSIDNYIEIRDKVAKAMAVSKYPYSNAGIVLPNNTHISRDDYWNSLSDNDQTRWLIRAQAAIDVFNDYTLPVVMQAAFDVYIDEK